MCAFLTGHSYTLCRDCTPECPHFHYILTAFCAVRRRSPLLSARRNGKPDGCACDQPVKHFYMIEIHNADRTRSFGRFACFKAAAATLAVLAAGTVPGAIPAVSVSSYRNGILQREYEAVFLKGKWRERKMPSLPGRHTVPQARPVRKHPRKLCRIYPTPEHCFREGLPDWLNRSCPVPYADSLKHCNRRCRVIR